METDVLEIFWRAGLFAVGAFVAGHHFLAAVAVERASHAARIVLLPCAVMSGVAICWSAVFIGSGVAVLWCAPALACVCVKDWLVWRSGAYISAALARSEELKAQQEAHP